MLALHEHKKASGEPAPGLLWIDEIREVGKANQVRPAFDVLLNESRHGSTFLLECGPRPVGIDPLNLSQADWCFLFPMRGVQDVARICEVYELDPDELRELMNMLEPHGFLRIDALHQNHVTIYPPIPA
jgi:hypothetical protein